MTTANSLINRTIYLASDHAGFYHKEAILKWLNEENIETKDFGAFTFDREDDFTDFVAKAAKAVSLNPQSACAIIFGGSGQGEAIMANRFPYVRAVVFYGGEAEIITLSRTHNDANILSIGARFVSIDDTKKYVWDWLQTFSSTQEKYYRRNLKIDVLKDL